MKDAVRSEAEGAEWKDKWREMEDVCFKDASLKMSSNERLWESFMCV